MKKFILLFVCFIFLVGCSVESDNIINNISVSATTIIAAPTPTSTPTLTPTIIPIITGTPIETTTEEKANIKFQKVTVTKHVDGDTVYITDEKDRLFSVRFIGVDCPESTNRTDFYGREASEYTNSQLLNKTVYIERDVSESDRYGRLLRYIWLDIPDEINENTIKEKMFNAILVSEGYAQVATYPPDVKYSEYFVDLQKDARDSNKGLWGIEVAETDQTEKVQKVNYKYVGSAVSDKYHVPSCKYAKNINNENLITFKSKSGAENEGYVPCKVCKP